jgi:hypothetical protein
MPPIAPGRTTVLAVPMAGVPPRWKFQSVGMKIEGTQAAGTTAAEDHGGVPCTTRTKDS